ncbi:hypothetical protein H0H87_001681 [Tephrocybe sp. NHM501043]|nr:hypothetical protein H0H87_001681 [Tephrocybe sp. NHM501043]
MSEGKAPSHNSETSSPGAPTTETVASAPDRSDLLSRARGFLQSPQIINQDIVAKRQFLVKKGLNEAEIDFLLRELSPEHHPKPLQRPTIPPRAYPQPPPSHLPTLILGITRVISWITGGSAAIIFLYYVCRLNESLESLKQSQKEAHSVLPSPGPSREATNFQACYSIPDVLKIVGDNFDSIPPVTLLRCALEGFGKGKEGDASQPSTEDLFRHMEGHIPWLVSEEGRKYEQTLWDTLSACPLFSGTSPATNDAEEHKPRRWTYTTPAPVEPSPIVESMKRLTTILPKNSELRHNSLQHTLQALSDFTGYISTQMYMPYQAPSSAAGFLNNGSSGGPAEEEFKREVRALKGLVLNRNLMREIIYIQAGKLSNYTGTHFWNTQENYLAEDSGDSIYDFDISFREGLSLTVQPTTDTTTGNFGTLAETNALIGTNEEENLYENSPVTWCGTSDRFLYGASPNSFSARNGSVSEFKQDPIPRSAYHESLEKLDESGESDDAQGEEPAKEDVRYWSDFNRVYYIPRTVQKIPDIAEWETAEGNWDYSQTAFAQYNEVRSCLLSIARTLSQARQDNALMEGSLRVFLEESDSPQVGAMF